MSTYWDQTSTGSLHPRLRFRTRVDVVIAESNGTITNMTLNFQDPFPMNSGVSVSQLQLTGFAGNFHLSATMNADPAVALSGTVNRRGSVLSLDGVAASTEFTHELRIVLKKKSN